MAQQTNVFPIPPEILLAIFEAVQDLPSQREHDSTFRTDLQAFVDVHQLAVLPLVCRQWLSPAMIILYRTIRISSSESAESLLLSFKTRPELGGYVRYLQSFQGSNSGQFPPNWLEHAEFNTRIKSICALCPSLRSLHLLHDGPFALPPPDDLLRSRNLSVLHIKRGDFFLSFLTLIAFPTLEELVIEDCEMRTTAKTTWPRMPRLRRLRLGFCTFESTFPRLWLRCPSLQCFELISCRCKLNRFPIILNSIASSLQSLTVVVAEKEGMDLVPFSTRGPQTSLAFMGKLKTLRLATCNPSIVIPDLPKSLEVLEIWCSSKVAGERLNRNFQITRDYNKLSIWQGYFEDHPNRWFEVRWFERLRDFKWHQDSSLNRIVVWTGLGNLAVEMLNNGEWAGYVRDIGIDFRARHTGEHPLRTFTICPSN